MERNIFRKAALEKLSTPEKLDQLITVIHRRSWLLLITLGLGIAGMIFWSFTGSITNQVQGIGMMIGLGVHDVVPLASGQIKEMKVVPGQKVIAGDVIALISQPDLEQQIEEAEARLADQITQKNQARLFGVKGNALQGDFINKQKLNLEQSIRDNEKILKADLQEVELKKDLLTQGLITRNEVLAVELRIDATRAEIENLKAEIKFTSTEELNVESNLDKILLSAEQRIQATMRLINQLKDRMEAHSRIISHYDGEVLEVLAEMGDVVTVGGPVIKLSKEGDDDEFLRTVIYVSARDGKKLKEGMEVLLAPATVKPQEYGYMKGTVSFVSEYPATEKGIMKILKNQQLVDQMLQIGAPFEVRVDLLKDADSETGYKWTSGQGPPGKVFPGTPCTSRIIVETQSPVTMVMPSLKNLFR